MTDKKYAHILVEPDLRDRLRVYKAKRGYTYTEALNELLEDRND